MAVMVITGGVLTFFRINSFDTLIHTRFGILLISKQIFPILEEYMDIDEWQTKGRIGCSNILFVRYNNLPRPCL